MNMFEDELKRAFAETPDPVDDGFTARISSRVAGKERARSSYEMARLGGMWFAALASIAAFIQLAWTYGLPFLASLGLGVAKAHGALAQADTAGSGALQTFSQAALNVGAGQLFIAMVVLVSGVFAFRQARD